MKKLVKKGHPAWSGKRWLALFLCLCLVGTMMPVTVKAAYDYSSTGNGGATVKTICLEPQALRPESTWSTGDNLVYFGTYDSSPVAYRVLASPNTQSTTPDGLLLDCDTILLTKPFDEDKQKNEGQTTNPNEWPGSDLETWLNGSDFYGSSSVFSNIEKAAIAETAFEGIASYTTGTENFTFTDYSAKNYVFCLSAVEAQKLYADDNIRKKTEDNAAWWLRSTRYGSLDWAGYVNSYCRVSGTSVDSSNVGVCPALNVDVSKILFASPAEDIKTSEAVDSTLTSPSYHNSEWKLTLKDSNRSSFTASRADGTGEVAAGGTVSIEYSGAETGSNEYVSVMLADASGEIQCYGRIANDSESGTKAVTIPIGLDAGTYTLKVYSEQCNGDYKTDYASNFVDISITVEAAAGPQALAAPTNPAWDNATPGKATWGSVANATGYTVTLYKGSTEVKSETVSNTYCDFTSDITAAGSGSYTFKVKANGDGTNYNDSTEAVSSEQTFYAVSFDTNGGGTIPTQIVVSGGKVSQPTTPVKDGYKFGGWYDSNALSNQWEFTSNTVSANATLYAKWLSTDAGVTAVYVAGTQGQISGNTITVVLPFGSTIPTDPSAVSVTTATGANTSLMSTNDNGATWTFQVTAEDNETIQSYTINVSVAASPLAGNQADVAAAKSVIENHNWTVAQGTANTSDGVKTWIEQQLGTMNLNGVAYTVNMSGGFTAAIAGTADDTDGTNGSFSFTVFLSKGEDTGNVATSTYANATTSVTNGAITATAYSTGGGNSSGGSTGGGSSSGGSTGGGSSSGGSTGGGSSSGGSIGGGSSSGGSTGGGSSSGGNTSEVTTSKDSVSNTTTTTSPTEVKVEGGTASATVKTENMTEAIKQAADNKSAEIVFTVSEAESGNADTIRLTISKSDAQQILDKTAADLVVTTPAGDVILSQDTLGEVLLAAEGTNLTIEVAKVTNPTEVQKQAAGDNGYIVGVTIVSQSKAITTFGGKVLTIRLEIPAALVGKDVVAIHIADDGKTEKMPGKVVTEGTKQYYEFTTTHLSTFALIEETETKEEESKPEENQPEENQPEEETPTVSYPKKGTILTGSKTLRMYKITKAGLTGGTVQFIGTKNKTATSITIPATVTFGGITYKVTSIAAGALKNNKVITKVVIGKNVTVIGTGAFSGCTKLKSVTIGTGVVSINSKAFYNCTSLTTLTIPASVTKIWDYAFKGCSKLSTLKINSTKLTTKTLSGLSMKGISTKTVIKVPKSKLKTYAALFVKKGLSKKVTIKSL